MAKSVVSEAVDQIQGILRPLLQTGGFKVRGRTFNRTTDEGLVHVVNLQMGSSDPPGTAPMPGLRPNLHGLFAVNLGIYVPEVHQFHESGRPAKWVEDYDCCIRARLGALIGEGQEMWWHARNDQWVVSDLRNALETHGFPFFQSFGTRNRIVSDFKERNFPYGASSPPRIIAAIILAQRGETEQARELLYLQSLENLNSGHSA